MTRLARLARLAPADCARIAGGSIRDCACRTATGWLECPPGANGGPAALGARGNGADPNGADGAAPSRAMGFTGDMCDHCGNFRMVRSGTCLHCAACGASSGCS